MFLKKILTASEQGRLAPNPDSFTLLYCCQPETLSPDSKFAPS